MSFEYSGKVRHEKRADGHLTHFAALGRKFKHTQASCFEWVEVSVGRWKRIKKEVKHGKEKVNRCSGTGGGSNTA